MSEYTSDPALFFYTPQFFFPWILSKLEVQKVFLVIQIFTKEFSCSKNGYNSFCCYAFELVHATPHEVSKYGHAGLFWKIITDSKSK